MGTHHCDLKQVRGPQMECQLRSAAILHFLASHPSSSPQHSTGDPAALLNKLRLGGGRQLQPANEQQLDATLPAGVSKLWKCHDISLSTKHVQ